MVNAKTACAIAERKKSEIQKGNIWSWLLDRIQLRKFAFLILIAAMKGESCVAGFGTIRKNVENKLKTRGFYIRTSIWLVTNSCHKEYKDKYEVYW